MPLVITTVQQNSLYSEMVVLCLSVGFTWGAFEQARSFSNYRYTIAAPVHSSPNPEGKRLDVLTTVKKSKQPVPVSSVVTPGSHRKLFLFPVSNLTMPLSPFINMLLLQLSTENTILHFLCLLPGNCSGSCYRKKQVYLKCFKLNLMLRVQVRIPQTLKCTLKGSLFPSHDQLKF